VVAEPVVDSPVTMSAMPTVGSPIAEIDEEEPVFQELIANHEEEQQHPLCRMWHMINLLEDLRGSEGQLSLMTMRFMLAKKFK
jgi:hypothetical protein